MSLDPQEVANSLKPPQKYLGCAKGACTSFVDKPILDKHGRWVDRTPQGYDEGRSLHVLDIGVNEQDEPHIFTKQTTFADIKVDDFFTYDDGIIYKKVECHEPANSRNINTDSLCSFSDNDVITLVTIKAVPIDEEAES